MATDFTSRLTRQGYIFAFALITLWIMVITAVGLRLWMMWDDDGTAPSLEEIVIFDKVFFTLAIVVTIYISIIGVVVAKLYTSLNEAYRNAERERDLALEQERENIRIKRQLTNNINHELKTPICSILGYQEMILGNETLDPATIRAFVQKSYDQAERLRRLMVDLSTITRIDEAAVMIDREMVDIVKLIEGIVDDVQPAADRQNIEVVNKIDGLKISLDGNAMLLYSIFRNLVDNAIAYSGGRRVMIKLMSDSDTHYQFSVCDNGIGVDDKHLPHLFERFYRVDKGRSRKAGGTGLGLSIVKNAVLFHNGTIEAHTLRSGGCEFIFTLGR